jgi:hypothetical protein
MPSRTVADETLDAYFAEQQSAAAHARTGSLATDSARAENRSTSENVPTADAAECVLESTSWSIDQRMARCAAEFLAQLTFGDAERTAGDRERPCHAGFFADHGAGLAGVEECRRKAVGIIEILDESVGNSLLAG